MASPIETRGPTPPTCDREGFLYLHQEDRRSLKKFYCIAYGNELVYKSNLKDETPEETLNVLGATVKILGIRLKKKYGIEILLIDMPGIPQKTEKKKYDFYADTEEEAQEWFSIITRCTLPSGFPAAPYFSNTEEEQQILTVLPKLKDTAIPMRRALLWKKLRICALRFDMNEPQYRNQREMKRLTLAELVDASDNVRGLFNDQRSFQDVIDMISVNLFRALPTRDPNIPLTEDDDEENFSDPEWYHLALIYELLLHLVISGQIDISYKKHSIDNVFVEKLVSLFDSEDSREREYLKTVTHRIYGKLTNRRASLRKYINNVFYTFLYENQKHQGIAELLEILASIINGFTVPIRPEHKFSLEKALIPLHKMKQLETYHVQLIYCMTLYTAKETQLSTPIIKGLLRYWPYGNSNKEMLFLNELEELCELIRPENIVDYEVQLFTRIKKCIKSEHFQVAERALFLWSNPAFAFIAVDNRENRQVIFPILFEALVNNANNHWHEAVKSMSSHVLMQYSHTDPALYETVSSKYYQSQPAPSAYINQI
ncbi:hypothetical protein WA158_000952 [Blastocystis sp. Blastoise]